MIITDMYTNFFYGSKTFWSSFTITMDHVGDHVELLILY